jgi:hypothetical protein
MPDHTGDIPIQELQIFDADELIFDGSDPTTYIVIAPGTSAADMTNALGWDDLPESAGEQGTTGDDVDPGRSPGG